MNRDSLITRAIPTSRRRGRAAFTLIEIMVALSAGVLVSMAAFALSKNATTFFQHEARISTAQLSLTLGLNRLTADLQRASFLSTANAKVDPMVCRGDWSTAQGLNSLAGVQIKPGTLAGAGTSQSGQNGLKPDQLIVGGSLDASEAFVVQCVLSQGSAPALQLQTAQYDGAMARLNASLGPGESLQSRLALIFAPGRFVQILDPSTGYKSYGVLGDAPNVTVNAGVATVLLKSSPGLPQKPNSFCGMVKPPACGGGQIVSVVYRAKYDVRSLQGSGTPYATLVAAPPGIGAATGDTGRTELVRVELDASGAEVQSSTELVAEYAVDLRFGLTVASRVQETDYNPTTSTFKIGDPAIPGIVDDVATTTATPQLVRGVQVRLATRTRAPDRDTDVIPTNDKSNDGRLLRFLVPGAQPQYARVRTGYATVSLPNQGGFSLW